jgi:hypothetical protein
MKKKYLLVTTLIYLATNPLSLEAKGDSLMLVKEESGQIVVNNKIVAKVNGKAISVMDLMKKLDVLFYRQFPQYASSVPARYQFYMANWKYILQDIVDKELILADAEENKFEVSSGDVREEMEALFGPNIITNLDKIGMTFDQAYKEILGDITIRRMVFVRVNAKAMRQVTPKDILAAYEEFAKENMRTDEWNYSVITVRDPDPTKGAIAANEIHHLLVEQNIPLEELQEKFKENPTIPSTATVNISKEMSHNEKEISESYKDILSPMKEQTFSHPIPQKSRADKGTVFRIFFLRKMTPGGPVLFSEVENKIKDKLIEDSSNIETDLYLKKLRKHFDVQDDQLKQMISDDFQPFSLK